MICIHKKLLVFSKEKLELRRALSSIVDVAAAYMHWAYRRRREKD
jgi:hypothetical protein